MVNNKTNKPTSRQKPKEHRNAEAFPRSIAFYDPVKVKLLSLTTLNTVFDDDEFEEFDAETLAMLDAIEADLDLNDVFVGPTDEETL